MYYLWPFIVFVSYRLNFSNLDLSYLIGTWSIISEQPAAVGQ